MSIGFPEHGQLVVNPLVPGHKYTLRGALPNGTGADWDGTELIENPASTAEFIVVDDPVEGCNRVIYPMLFELAQLRAGGAIRSRQVTCYYKTQHDNCAPVMIQPEMKLIRLNEWRLSLSPTVCAISATALTDPTSTKPTHGNS